MSVDHTGGTRSGKDFVLWTLLSYIRARYSQLGLVQYFSHVMLFLFRHAGDPEHKVMFKTKMFKTNAGCAWAYRDVIIEPFERRRLESCGVPAAVSKGGFECIVH